MAAQHIVGGQGILEAVAAVDELQLDLGVQAELCGGKQKNVSYFFLELDMELKNLAIEYSIL